jgi:membrane protein YqaA with SNARE-associated domain
MEPDNDGIAALNQLAVSGPSSQVGIVQRYVCAACAACAAVAAVAACAAVAGMVRALAAARQRWPRPGPYATMVPMTDRVLQVEPRDRNVVRRLYDWMLSWADRKAGPAALLGISFAESSVFPLPPDPLLLALALGRPSKALVFATICTVGSVAGGVAGYAIGWFVWETVGDFFFRFVPGVTPEGFAQVQAWYSRWGFWAVFLAGFTPLPYKVFTLASGVFAISLPVFIIASTISRGARFFLVAGLVYFFGAPIQSFIDRHFNRLAWLFGILLVGGFVVLRFLR